MKVASMQRPGEGSGCSDDVVKVARKLAMHTGLSIRSVVKQENVFDHVTETRSGVVRGRDQTDGPTELSSIDLRGGKDKSFLLSEINALSQMRCLLWK